MDSNNKVEITFPTWLWFIVIAITFGTSQTLIESAVPWGFIIMVIFAESALITLLWMVYLKYRKIR